MELLEAIKGRRSIYAYKPDPVPEETLMQLLEAATWAPSHRNSQPWEFVLIGPETRKQLAAVFREAMEIGPLSDPAVPEARKEVFRRFMNDFGGAPALVAVMSRPPEKEIDRAEFPISTGVAVQNLMLTAHAAGLGTVWVSVGRHPKARPILQVPDGYDVVAVLPIGYPAEVPPAPPREPVATKLRRLP